MWRRLALAGLLLQGAEADVEAPPQATTADSDVLQGLYQYISELASANSAGDAQLRAALQAVAARLAAPEWAQAPAASQVGAAAAAEAEAVEAGADTKGEATPRADPGPRRPSLRGIHPSAGTALHAEPAAYTVGHQRSGAAKFRVVASSPGPRQKSSPVTHAAASSTPKGELRSQRAVSNPFLFTLDGELLRYSPNRDLCASVRGGWVYNGAEVILWTCRDSREFQWVLAGDQLVLASDRRYCLSLRGGVLGAGADAVVRPCASPTAGHWVLDGERIRYAENKNYCLSVREGLAGDGSDLILWACDEAWLVADWVVVGGGAAGCAAAAALADAGENVVVLERGPSDLSIPETRQAQTWPAVVNTEAVEPIRWTDGTWGAVAQVLGGGTSINGGLFIEEEPDFFQAALGPEVDLDELYASSRYLAANLTTPLQPSTFGNDFAEALKQVGLDHSNDAPRPQVRWSEGSWVAYSTTNSSHPGYWPRRGAAALLHDREGLPNLEVLTGYQVRRIAFDGTRAVGVQAIFENDGAFIPARKGVIMAAGAIYTPQLLQVSGVGDSELLRRLGVRAVSELPVGKNFIDRPVSTVGVWSAVDVPLHVGYAVNVDRQLNLTTESVGGGRVASEFTVASLAFAPPNQRSELLRWTFRLIFGTPVADLLNNMLQLVALQHSPKSRGQVEATSSEPTGPPEVTANHLAEPEDLEAQLVALNKLLDIAGSQALERYARPKLWSPPRMIVPEFFSCFTQQPSEKTRGIVFPCLPAPDSPAERWRDFVRNTVVSSYHYFGTAAMGKVLEGPDFRVKGTENLHVVDASVFPMPTRVNPQGTIMAVGHYAGKRLAALSKRRLHSVEGVAAPGPDHAHPDVLV